MANLQKSVERPAHAYLFLGPRSVGKTTAALELAKALNCESDFRPCQECANCRLVSHGAHPDVFRLSANDKDNIVIDQARTLRQELVHKPTQARYRVVVLQADQLTESAADALLKTLEEPPDHAVLILTGHDLASIPETVVSRCRIVSFLPVPETVIEDVLIERGAGADAATHLAKLAHGAIGWAIDASEDDDLVTQREELQADLERWFSGSLAERLAVAERLAASGGKLDKSRSLAMEELELLLMYWRDMLIASCGADGGSSRNESPLPSVPTTEQALSALRAISKAATRIRENVDPRLSLEAMAVRF